MLLIKQHFWIVVNKFNNIRHHTFRSLAHYSECATLQLKFQCKQHCRFYCKSHGKKLCVLSGDLKQSNMCYRYKTSSGIRRTYPLSRPKTLEEMISFFESILIAQVCNWFAYVFLCNWLNFRCQNGHRKMYISFFNLERNKYISLPQKSALLFP